MRDERRETNPMAFWVDCTDRAASLFGRTPREGNVRNKPNGALDELRRLCGHGLEPVESRRGRNEPNGVLGEIHQLCGHRFERGRTPDGAKRTQSKLG
jgi:hypothetical protein